MQHLLNCLDCIIIKYTVQEAFTTPINILYKLTFFSENQIKSEIKRAASEALGSVTGPVTDRLAVERISPLFTLLLCTFILLVRPTNQV